MSSPFVGKYLSPKLPFKPGNVEVPKSIWALRGARAPSWNQIFGGVGILGGVISPPIIVLFGSSYLGVKWYFSLIAANFSTSFGKVT